MYCIPEWPIMQTKAHELHQYCDGGWDDLHGTEIGPGDH